VHFCVMLLGPVPPVWSLTKCLVVLGGLVVSVLASGPRFVGPHPAEGDKNLQHPFRGSKAFSPMS
jgi:hypothetical protein